MPESDTLLSPLQAALRLGVSTRTITRWSEDPDVKLPVAATTPGGQRRFRLTDVEALASQRQAGAA